MESEDDIVCLDDGTKSINELSDEQIQKFMDLFVDEELENGRDPKDLKLKDIIQRINATGYEEKLLEDTDVIKRICRILRKTQKSAEKRTKPAEELQKIYAGNISGIDLKTLQPREWLNDNIINRYMVLISEQYFSRFVAISSFLPQSLSNANRKPIKIPDIRNKVGLMPLNAGAHWSLVLIMVNQKTIMLLDSMRSVTKYSKQVLDYLVKLRLYLEEQQYGSFQVKLHLKVRQQTNSDDCGVFVCAYARSLAEMDDTHVINRIGQRQMSRMRKLIQSEIINGSLNSWSDFLESIQKTLTKQVDPSKVTETKKKPPKFEIIS